MNCDPQSLITSASCLRCVPRGTLREVMIYLLCQWASSPSGCGTPSNTIRISGAGDAGANQDYVYDGIRYIGQTDVTYSISLAAGVWYITKLPATHLYSESTFPCSWQTVLGTNPPPTGQYIAEPVPLNLTLPVIVGTAQVGQTLSGSNGTWAYLPTGYTYRWLANGVAIGGATANTFLLTAAQVGAIITFEVTASNSSGAGTPAISLGTSAVISAGQAAANDWATRVVTNGGAAPSAGTKTALATFYDALDSAGIRTKMLALNCMVPDSLIAALTPLIKLIGSDPWANNSFVAGDLAIDGLKGNTPRYINLNFVALDLPSLNHGFTIYASYSDFGDMWDLGAFTGTYFAVSTQNNGNTLYYDSGTPAGLLSAGASVPYLGYFSCNRVNTSDQRIFRASSTIPHGQTGFSGTVIPDQRAISTGNFFLYAYQNGGVAGGHSTRRMSFVAIHYGLSLAESNSFYNAIQALRTALGGGFV